MADDAGREAALLAPEYPTGWEVRVTVAEPAGGHRTWLSGTWAIRHEQGHLPNVFDVLCATVTVGCDCGYRADVRGPVRDARDYTHGINHANSHREEHLTMTSPETLSVKQHLAMQREEQAKARTRLAGPDGTTLWCDEHRGPWAVCHAQQHATDEGDYTDPDVPPPLTADYIAGWHAALDAATSALRGILEGAKDEPDVMVALFDLHTDIQA